VNLSGLPEAAFVDPGGGNRASVDALAGRALDLVLSLAAEASSRYPLPEGEDASDVGVLREAPVPEGELLEELRGLLVRSMNAAHPGYVGHMDSMPTTASVLGDLAASAVVPLPGVDDELVRAAVLAEALSEVASLAQGDPGVLLAVQDEDGRSRPVGVGGRAQLVMAVRIAPEKEPRLLTRYPRARRLE